MKLLLIDANSLIHRAFHALPPLTSPDGAPAGALYGLSATLLKILERHKPEYIAAAFDRPEPTFRKIEFDDYKAQRPKAPDELISQLKEAHRLFSAFGIPTFEKAGFEADDLIGTIAQKFKKEKGIRIIILTGDMDTLQLVEDPFLAVEALKKGVSETVVYDEKAVKERYDIIPKQLTDYKGLVGDASDNIPGVRGIGPKSAARLLNKYGTLEEILKKLPENDPSYEKIKRSEKEAILSKKLGTVKCDVPLSVSLEDMRFSYDPGKESIVDYFKLFGFDSLLKRIGKETVKKPAEKRLKNKSGNAPKHSVVLDEKDVPKNGAGGVLVAYDWKTIFKKNPEAATRDIFDVLIAAWLVDSNQKDLSLSSIASRFIEKGVQIESREEKYSAIEALFEHFTKKLEEYDLKKVFYEIETPLISVLAEIESRGISIDRIKLEKLRGEVSAEIKILIERVEKEAGEKFNISSPKQVGEILFDKLGIGGKTKKTKTGAHSTTEEVLSKLKEENEIVRHILEYRENTKMLSTYVDPLLDFSKKDGRIHTTFLQTGTATGRFSSEQPNLQNIPQESKWATALRKTFVAPKGFRFVSFDYSQLELRLLAHITGDEELKRAFVNGDDIHTITASKILNLPESSITKEARRVGKILNFGIVYGMGPRAFAKTGDITFDEARRFINEYLRRFPGVKQWREKVATEVKTTGYVTDENGRRRWFPETEQLGARGAAETERAAINMPVQGLEADILKIAMIKNQDFLKKGGWSPKKARMVLTIHDELIFEIADDILEETARELKKIMEGCYAVSVPLVVEVRAGTNWGEMQKLDL